jgi:hypothetical protein
VDAKQKFPRREAIRSPAGYASVSIHAQQKFDTGAFTGDFGGMIPSLPTLTGAAGGWLVLALKALAAGGFMTLANVVIVYAS